MVKPISTRMSRIVNPLTRVTPRNARSPACRLARRSVTVRLMQVPGVRERDGPGPLGGGGPGPSAHWQEVSSTDLGNVVEGLLLQLGRQRRVVDSGGQFLTVGQQVGEETAEGLGLRWVLLRRVGDDPRLGRD